MEPITVRKTIISFLAVGGAVIALTGHAAATDYCSLVTPEDLSKAFGTSFGLPKRSATPSGPLAGPSVTCTYAGATLEVTIASFESLTVAKNQQGYEIRRSRELAKSHAVDVTAIGDGAFYTHNKIDSRKGTHDYTFSVQASGADLRKDWKNPLIGIAQIFYGRLH